jgi:hypothetical protein
MKSAAIVLQSPIGRSDPQAIYLACSLNALGIKVTIIQCIHPDSVKIPYTLLPTAVEVLNFRPIIPMWSGGAVAEFSLFASKIIYSGRFDTVFSFDYTGILASAILLEKGGWIGNTCLFMLENIQYMIGSHGETALSALKYIWSKSVVVYPEPNRLLIDSSLYQNILGVNPNVYILPATVPRRVDNPTDSDYFKYRNIDKRSLKVIYAGSVVSESFVIDFAKHIIKSKGELDFTLDIFGPVGADCIGQLQAVACSAEGRVNYRGIVNQITLSKIYPEYDLSLVAWRPVSANFYFASPNKFFQAISSLVIPITTMNPLVSAAIDTHQLNTIKLDWNSDHWNADLLQASNLRLEYSGWAQNNYNKFSSSLSWDEEFNKFFEFIIRKFC